MTLVRLRKVVDRALETVLALLMAGMVLVVLWQIVARFLLHDPSSFTEELVRFALLWLGLLGASYALGKRAHLAVDLLPNRLAPGGRRRLQLVIQLAVAGFALLVPCIGGSLLVASTLELGQRSAALGMDRGYVYLALPISGSLWIFYAVATLLEGET